MKINKITIAEVLADLEEQEKVVAEAKKSYIKIAEIDVEIPKKPVDRLIDNYGLSKNLQVFKRIVQPDFTKISDFEATTFVKQEYSRFINGYWFFNDEVATYISGFHYFFLNYCKLPEGFPDYIDVQREILLFWNFCVSDINSYGLILMKGRRVGATSLFLAEEVFEAITNMNIHCGMVSKTGKKDAAKQFERLTHIFDKLPKWLKPQIEGNARAKSELRIIAPSKRATVNNQSEETKGLDNLIDWQSTDENAYDGFALHRGYVDEPGKWTEVNINEFWRIFRKTLVKGKHIRGKACFTSTVNSPQKGGANFKKIWEDSNYFNKDDNGRTKSGMYKLFVPAYKGLEGFIDVYGNSVIEDPEKGKEPLDKQGAKILIGSKTYLLNERKALEGDPELLAEEKRQMPFTEQEALRNYDSICHFNRTNITSQLDWMESEKKNIIMPVKGNFRWEGGIRDSKVLWNPDPNGRWQLLVAPDEGKDNVRMSQGKEFMPLKSSDFVSGVDPFDHDYVVEKSRFSLGASHVYKIHKPEDPNNSDLFACQYQFRPPTANLFYEDMIMQCVFFGAELFVENDRGAIKGYFKERGYGAYLMKIPTGFFEGNNNTKLTEGVSANKSRTALINLIEEHSYNNCHKMFFKETLEDWLDFDASDTTKSDLTMSSGYTLIAANRHNKVMLNSNSDTPMQLMRTYKVK